MRDGSEGGRPTYDPVVMFKVLILAARHTVAARAKGCDRERAWRRLAENPDDGAHWRAHAGPTVREAPPYVFRRQTEVDLKAARWNLLAWEDPRHPQWAGPFWADMPMVEARVAERRLLRWAGARFSGLWLLDGRWSCGCRGAGRRVRSR